GGGFPGAAGTRAATFAASTCTGWTKGRWPRSWPTSRAEAGVDSGRTTRRRIEEAGGRAANPSLAEARARVVLPGNQGGRAREELHRSLDRLGVDRVDLWQLHSLADPRRTSTSPSGGRWAGPKSS